MRIPSVVRRLVLATPAGILTLVLAGGVVVAVASIPDALGIFHGCYAKTTGALRVVSDARQCIRTETAIQWNQQGQPGQPGPQGPAGPQGPQGPQGLQGPPGSSSSTDAFATYRELGDARGPISADQNGVTVAVLNLPAGSYVASASLYATNQTGSSGILYCLLIINNERNAQAITTLQPGQAASQALTVADTLNAPAQIRLFCNNNVLGGTGLDIETFNLTAIRTGTLSIASS